MEISGTVGMEDHNGMTPFPVTASERDSGDIVRARIPHYGEHRRAYIHAIQR